MPDATPAQATGSEKTARKPWNVVVLYDERPACHRAVSTLGRLLPEHARASGVCTLTWRFSDWEDEAQQQAMVDAILASDLIVVAPSSDTPVPMVTIEWLGRLLSNRTRVPTVMTVCDPAAETRDANDLSAALLRRIAVAAGLVSGGEASENTVVLTS